MASDSVYQVISDETVVSGFQRETIGTTTSGVGRYLVERTGMEKAVEKSYGLGAWNTSQNHRPRFQKFLQIWVK